MHHHSAAREASVKTSLAPRPSAPVIDLGVVRAILRYVRDADIKYAVKLATSSGREARFASRERPAAPDGA